MNIASRNKDPYSSHLAESDITTSGERQIQNDIALDVVILFPGLTSKELASHCPLDRYQLARRLNDLFLQNKVDKTDGKQGEQKWYKGSGKILSGAQKQSLKPVKSETTNRPFDGTLSNESYALLDTDEKLAYLRFIQWNYPREHREYRAIQVQIDRLKEKL